MNVNVLNCLLCCLFGLCVNCIYGLCVLFSRHHCKWNEATPLDDLSKLNKGWKINWLISLGSVVQFLFFPPDDCLSCQEKKKKKERDSSELFCNLLLALSSLKLFCSSLLSYNFSQIQLLLCVWIENEFSDDRTKTRTDRAIILRLRPNIRPVNEIKNLGLWEIRWGRHRL